MLTSAGQERPDRGTSSASSTFDRTHAFKFRSASGCQRAAAGTAALVSWICRRKMAFPKDAWGQRTGKFLAALELKAPTEINSGSLQLNRRNRILVQQDPIQASSSSPSAKCFTININ
jgi:hypothetical protein